MFLFSRWCVLSRVCHDKLTWKRKSILNIWSVTVLNLKQISRVWSRDTQTWNKRFCSFLEIRFCFVKKLELIKSLYNEQHSLYQHKLVHVRIYSQPHSIDDSEFNIGREIEKILILNIENCLMLLPRFWREGLNTPESRSLSHTITTLYH